MRVIGLGVFFTKQNDIISKRNVNEVLMNIGNKSKAESFSIKEISCLFCVCGNDLLFSKKVSPIVGRRDVFIVVYVRIATRSRRYRDRVPIVVSLVIYQKKGGRLIKGDNLLCVFVEWRTSPLFTKLFFFCVRDGVK